MDKSAEEFATDINETILKFNAEGLPFSSIITELAAILDNLEEENTDEEDDEDE